MRVLVVMAEGSACVDAAPYLYYGSSRGRMNGRVCRLLIRKGWLAGKTGSLPKFGAVSAWGPSAISQESEVVLK